MDVNRKANSKKKKNPMDTTFIGKAAIRNPRVRTAHTERNGQIHGRVSPVRGSKTHL